MIIPLKMAFFLPKCALDCIVRPLMSKKSPQGVGGEYPLRHPLPQGPVCPPGLNTPLKILATGLYQYPKS